MMLALHNTHVARRDRLLRVIASKIPSKLWIKDRSADFFTKTVPEMKDEEFKQKFRMARPTFNKLVAELKPHVKYTDTVMRKCIPLEERVAITLLRLGTNATYSSISKMFGRGTSTGVRIVQDITQALASHLMKKFVTLPEGDELSRLRCAFEEKSGFPQVAGCIDQIEIKVQRPQESLHGYISLDRPQSVLLQAVVDNNYCFTNVDINWLRNEHDGQVFENSELFKLGEGNRLFPGARIVLDGMEVPAVILGKPMHPLLTWLMKPYAGNDLSSAQLSFNQKLISARFPVEGAFNKLRSRWRCLLTRLDCVTNWAQTIIAACCTLHNFCQKNNDFFYDDEIPSTSSYDGAENTTQTEDAANIRDVLSSYLSNNGISIMNKETVS